MVNPTARKINREMVVLLGWGPAILLQLAHPLVAAGVGEYSAFSGSSRGYLARGRRTIGAMLELTFGSPEAARRIVDRINAIHDRVHGELPAPVGIFPAGTKYSARDPRLLCWVHATLVDSLVQAYELFVGPLSAREKDQYATEAAGFVMELGVDPAQVPATYAEVQAFMRDRYESGEVVVGPQARQLAGALLAPSGPLAPALALSRLITIGQLPPHIRAAYGFPWNNRRQRAFARAAKLIRVTRRGLPSILREWPMARRDRRQSILDLRSGESTRVGRNSAPL